MTRKYVFISHAGADQRDVEEMVRFLETAGIVTWIAPRDVRPGQDYSDQILKAIEAAAAVIVTVSERSNESKFVRAEAEIAFSRNRPIYPVRFHDVAPAAGLALFLQLRPSTNAFGPGRDDALGRLAGELRAVTSARQSEAASASVAAERPRESTTGHIFLSHSHKDRPQVDALAADLERHGLKVWMAPRDIPLGGNFMTSTGRAIEDCKAFVVVLSKQSNHSMWVHSETGTAYTLEKQIFPVHLADIAPSTELRIAVSLQQRTDAFGPSKSRNIERLAASLANADGLRHDDGGARQPPAAFQRALVVAGVGIALLLLAIWLITGRAEAMDVSATPLLPAPQAGSTP